MAGINRVTGKPLGGIDHVFQSMNTAISTSKKSRVMRRHLGSVMPRLVDRSVSPLTLIDFFAAIAEIAVEEPRIRLVQMQLSKDESELIGGRPVFDAEVLHYPRGHLGDFSEVETASGRFVVAI